MKPKFQINTKSQKKPKLRTIPKFSKKTKFPKKLNYKWNQSFKRTPNFKTNPNYERTPNFKRRPNYEQTPNFKRRENIQTIWCSKTNTKLNHNKRIHKIGEWVIRISLFIFHSNIYKWEFHLLSLQSEILKKATILRNLLLLVLLHTFSRMSLKLPKTEKLTKAILLGNSLFLITC